MNDIIHRLDAIPIVLPEHDIRSRLEFSRHRTRLGAADCARLDAGMREGFAQCRFAGCFRCIPIDLLGSLPSGLAELLAGCTEVLLMAATAGPDIGRAAQEAMARGELARAVILDATGSECADEAMNFVQQHARHFYARTGGTVDARRFSPGYGNWPLTAQKLFFAQLELDRLGMALDASCTMTPEKSVTAVAGIRFGAPEQPRKKEDFSS